MHANHKSPWTVYVDQGPWTSHGESHVQLASSFELAMNSKNENKLKKFQKKLLNFDKCFKCLQTFMTKSHSG